MVHTIMLQNSVLVSLWIVTNLVTPPSTTAPKHIPAQPINHPPTILCARNDMVGLSCEDVVVCLIGCTNLDNGTLTYINRIHLV